MEATQDSTAVKAQELAALAGELVNSAEGRAREEVARRIGAILMEAAKAPTAEPKAAPEKPPLEEVAHSQSNALYDVVALLAAIADRIDAHSSARADDDMHSTLRLAQMAQKRVGAVIDAFDPYI